MIKFVYLSASLITIKVTFGVILKLNTLFRRLFEPTVCVTLNRRVKASSYTHASLAK